MFVLEFKVVYAMENLYMCGKLDMYTYIPEVWEYQRKKVLCAEFIQNWVRIFDVVPGYWKLICQVQKWTNHLRIWSQNNFTVHETWECSLVNTSSTLNFSTMYSPYYGFCFHSDSDFDISHMLATDSWCNTGKCSEIFLAVLIVNSYVPVAKLPTSNSTGKLEIERRGLH